MGYIVTGIDLFVWLLITAGAIIIPVIVLTICCVKKHFADERKLLAKQYLLQDGFSIKGSAGHLGPFTSSNDTLFNQNSKKLIPASLIITPNNGNINNNEKNHVRFKEDNYQRMFNNYTNNGNNNEVPTDLRNLKDSLNQFNSRMRPQPTPKYQGISEPSGLPVLDYSGQSNNLNDNSSSSYKSISNSNNYESVLESINILPQILKNDQVFSVTQASFRIPSSSQRPTTSIENIYSQVQPKRVTIEQQEQEMKQAAVYMNAPYMNNLKQQQHQNNINDYTSWNENSV